MRSSSPPQYGTIEIRVCDTPLTVKRAALLAAYAQALAAYYLAARPHEPSRAVYLVNSHNRFEACRYGLCGELVEPYSGTRKRIGDDILETLLAVMPQAARLECGEALVDGIRKAESDAGWLRERRAARGSLPDVVREACARWAGQ